MLLSCAAQLRIYDFSKTVLLLPIILNKKSVKDQSNSLFLLAKQLVLTSFALYFKPPNNLSDTTLIAQVSKIFEYIAIRCLI